MRRRPRLSAAASRDLDAIWWYVAERSGAERARALLEQLFYRMSLLGERPKAGRLRPDLGKGRRSLAFGSYVAIYRLEGAEAVIVRVLHGHRDQRRALDETELDPTDD